MGANSERVSITAINRVTNTVTLGAVLQNAHALNDDVDAPGKERVLGMYRLADTAQPWTRLTLPGDADGGIHPGGQADKHFSLLADGTDPNVVFVGGDRQLNISAGGNAAGATNFTGRLFRGVVGAAGTTAWATITDNGADPDGAGGAAGTGPHADSRNMVFAANGTDILEVDDGGIFKLAHPNNAATRVWSTLNSNLRLT